MDRGDTLGPLHGIPISIKDLEATKDMNTTMGSAVFRDRATEMDSIVVERVRQAGAIVLGKTNAPEFGITPPTENKLGDACRNPWNIERTPGGSSGGAAAALAAGLCTLSTGSDGGGSIRIPSSFSGLFGIKPTQGRLPRYGGYGRPSANYFSQSGPMSHTVEDSALLLQVLAGPDRRDVTCIREAPADYKASLEGGVSGWRTAWSPDLGYAPVDPEVVRLPKEQQSFSRNWGRKSMRPIWFTMTLGLPSGSCSPTLHMLPMDTCWRNDATTLPTMGYASWSTAHRSPVATWPGRRCEWTSYGVRWRFSLTSTICC